MYSTLRPCLTFLPQLQPLWHSDQIEDFSDLLSYHRFSLQLKETGRRSSTFAVKDFPPLVSTPVFVASSHQCGLFNLVRSLLPLVYIRLPYLTWHKRFPSTPVVRPLLLFLLAPPCPDSGKDNRRPTISLWQLSSVYIDPILKKLCSWCFGPSGRILQVLARVCS